MHDIFYVNWVKNDRFLKNTDHDRPKVKIWRYQSSEYVRPHP